MPPEHISKNLRVTATLVKDITPVHSLDTYLQAPQAVEKPLLPSAKWLLQQAQAIFVWSLTVRAPYLPGCIITFFESSLQFNRPASVARPYHRTKLSGAFPATLATTVACYMSPVCFAQVLKAVNRYTFTSQALLHQLLHVAQQHIVTIPLRRHASVEAQERGGAHIVCPGPCPSRWTARA